MKNLVKNVPTYAHDEQNPYWVVSAVDNDLWFYGAYESKERAYEVAMSLNKLVVY